MSAIPEGDSYTLIIYGYSNKYVHVTTFSTTTVLAQKVILPYTNSKVCTTVTYQRLQSQL